MSVISGSESVRPGIRQMNLLSVIRTAFSIVFLSAAAARGIGTLLKRRNNKSQEE